MIHRYWIFFSLSFCQSIWFIDCCRDVMRISTNVTKKCIWTLPTLPLILVTVIFLMQVWNHALCETYTCMNTHKCAPPCSQTHAHTVSVVHGAISQCWDWVNRFIFPPLVHMGNLSVLKKVVCLCLCGSVNFSSADTLIYPLYICICVQCD